MPVVTKTYTYTDLIVCEGSQYLFDKFKKAIIVSYEAKMKWARVPHIGDTISYLISQPVGNVIEIRVNGVKVL